MEGDHNLSTKHSIYKNKDELIAQLDQVVRTLGYEQHLTMPRIDAALALALGVHITWDLNAQWPQVIRHIHKQNPGVLYSFTPEQLRAMLIMALEARDER